MAGSPGGAGGGSRLARFLLFTGLSVLLVVALAVVDILVLGFNPPARALSPHYYMALGNSLSFGYQPNLDFSAGFADDIYNDLRASSRAGDISLENLACAGETTDTMIGGGCVARFAHKGFYTGAQLTAALDFIKAHPGHISPITLEIGANDVLKDFDSTTCTVNTLKAQGDMTQMDTNLVGVILPQLLKALASPAGASTGDLHLLNYYNPFANACPTSAPFIQLFNSHLQADAARFKVPVVDIYGAFNNYNHNAGMAANVCALTWYCSPERDIHPNDTGYQLIARTVEVSLGLPGTNPLPGIGVPAPAPPIGLPPAGDIRSRLA